MSLHMNDKVQLTDVVIKHVGGYQYVKMINSTSFGVEEGTFEQVRLSS